MDIPFFNDLRPKDRIDLEKKLVFQTYEDGQLILEHHEVSDDVYFILEGATKSFTYGPNGEMAYFRLRQAGEYFGYYSAISGEPRTANMAAVGKTKLAKLSGKDFMRVVTHTPALSEKVLKLIMGILREETNRITHIITLNAQELISAEIAEQSLLQQSKTITMPTREELAGRLGLTRETVSRVFSKLAKDGVIKTDGKQVEILDFEALR